MYFYAFAKAMAEQQIDIKILDETAPLEAVIVGLASDIGIPGSKYVHPDNWEGEIAPYEDKVNDPKSRWHLLNGTYPLEEDLRPENQRLLRVLAKYNVKVYQPRNLPAVNQIFTRDIGFVIDEVFIKANMKTSKRQAEFFAIRDIVSDISQEIWFPPKSVTIEGGDVFPFKDKIFVGQAAKGSEGLRCDRTNPEAIEYLKRKFDGVKEIVPVPLHKSDKDPKMNALHLDCVFQPFRNNDTCVVFPEGFESQEQAADMVSLFGGEDNAIKITGDHMYHMNSNFFSISPSVVVSGQNESEFGWINEQIRDKGVTVETIPYSETSKMEGLLRCSTLPLKRTYS